MKAQKDFLSRLAAASLVSGLFCLPVQHSQAQILFGSTAGSTTVFSGSAVAAAGMAGSSFVSVANAGLLSTTAGAQEASALETSLGGGVSVGASHATTIGGDNTVSSEASVASVSYVHAGGIFGGSVTVTADFVMSSAS